MNYRFNCQPKENLWLIRERWIIFVMIFPFLFFAQTGVLFGVEESKEVTLLGTNSCKMCDEPQTPESGTKCSIFGHTCYFLVGKAVDKEGKDIKELPGKWLNYKLNEQSIPLIRNEKYRGVRLEIKGKWLREKEIIDILSFKIEEEE